MPVPFRKPIDCLNNEFVNKVLDDLEVSCMNAQKDHHWKIYNIYSKKISNILRLRTSGIIAIPKEPNTTVGQLMFKHFHFNEYAELAKYGLGVEDKGNAWFIYKLYQGG